MGSDRPALARAQSIPRVIHWLWLGAGDIPTLFERYMDSWRRHHPQWQTRLWRDATLPTLSCQQQYEATRAFKTRYDMVRLELLRQEGGVILDMDVEAVRPIDALLPGVNAFAGRIAGGHVGNQVLGAVPHHPFFERALERIRTSWNADDSSSDAAGKGLLKNLLADAPGDITLFPPETFHFQPSFEPPKRPDDFPAVYAVHHELASYAAVAPASAIDEAVSNLMREVSAVQLAPADPGAQARLRKRELQLRRALSQQARGYSALFKRLEAEREYIEARMLDSERRLRRAAEGGVRARLRRLFAKVNDAP